MVWLWGMLTIIPILGGVAGLEAINASRVRRKRLEAATRAWKESRPADRIAVMQSLLDREICVEGRASLWYLLGCAHLRVDQTREAARAFGAAYHADFRVESAALLTFASLKTANGSSDRFPEHLATTWLEMGSPPVLRRPEDCVLVACLEATTRDPPELSALGRLGWAVCSRGHQERFEVILRSRCTDWSRALSAGAESD